MHDVNSWKDTWNSLKFFTNKIRYTFFTWWWWDSLQRIFPYEFTFVKKMRHVTLCLWQINVIYYLFVDPLLPGVWSMMPYWWLLFFFHFKYLIVLHNFLCMQCIGCLVNFYLIPVIKSISYVLYFCFVEFLCVNCGSCPIVSFVWVDRLINRKHVGYAPNFISKPFVLSSFVLHDRWCGRKLGVCEL